MAGFKTFGESFATETMTGRALDKATGGKLSAQTNKNVTARAAAARGVSGMNSPVRTAPSGTASVKGPGASMAAAKAKAASPVGKGIGGKTTSFGGSKIGAPNPTRSGGTSSSVGSKTGPSKAGGGTTTRSSSIGTSGAGMSKSSVAGPGGRKMAKGGMVKKK